MARHGRATLRAGYRSRRMPINGEHAATARAAMPKAADAASRDQPNSAVHGFKKMLNVYTNSEAKPTNTQPAAANVTRHPGYRKLCSSMAFEPGIKAGTVRASVGEFDSQLQEPRRACGKNPPKIG